MTSPTRVSFAATPAAPASPAGPPAPAADPVSPAPAPAPAAAVATRPDAGPMRRSTTGPRPVVHRTGPSLIARLLQLLRGSHARAGQLTAEDWRVILIPLAALLIASGATVDLDAPSAVTAPDHLPATSYGGTPAAAPAGGALVDDPTSKGRITETTAHGLAAMKAELGPAILSVSCWDAHAWNPSSDHPRGKACDVYTSPARQFAKGDGLTNGNRLVAWLRTNAGPLQVKYVIWQGRIWSPERGDRPYTGGGVYDPDDATGGHFDHAHISFRR